MKLAMILLVVTMLQVSAASYGQRITFEQKNVTLDKVFNEIRKQTGYSVLFSTVELKGSMKVNVDFKNVPLEEVLDKLILKRDLTYTIEEKVIIVKKKEKSLLDKVVELIQAIKITGRVTDTEGKPLAKVSVMVKGASGGFGRGLQTDADGKYTINANPGDILTFSFVGFKKKELKVGRTGSLDVVMEEETALLDQLVVLGYGTIEKRSLTGAVGSYSPNAIGALPNSIDNALVGRIAGVQVMPSGVPGSAPAITIRGITSINGKGNSPLIVIDGVPIYGLDKDNNTTNYSGRTYGRSVSGIVTGALSQNDRETFEHNPLELINPDDVESIEVLKDAYATAIYGSRGASGVILITTKKGKLNTPKVDVQLSTSFNHPFGEHKLMDGDQYADFYTAYYAARALNGVFPKGVNTDWRKEIERTGHSNNASFNASNGTEKGNYFISGSYTKDQPFIVGNDYDRFQGRINLNQHLSKVINVGTNMSLSSTQNSALNSNLLYGDAAIAAPNKPIYDQFGNYIWGNWNNPLVNNNGRDLNPVGYAATTINKLNSNGVVGNLFAELTVFSWAKLKSELGVDWETSRAYSRFTNKPRTLGGLASETNSWRRKWVINNTFNFNKQLGDHTLNGVVGQSFESSVENSTNNFASNFPNNQVLSLNSAGTRTFGSALEQQWALVSYFGRLNYLYKNKYFLGATYRLDGSSKFSSNQRYVGFPSFSAGWDLSRENFMKQFTFIDQFKLRGSLGLSGSDGGTGYYGNQGIYANYTGNANYGNEVAIVPTTPNNSDLKWEIRTKYNIGADISLFKSALNITFDYYQEKTKNAILTFPVPTYLGFSNQKQNIGELSNKGVELSIGSTNIDKNGFRWSSNFNIAHNVNKVEKLYIKNGLTDPIALAVSLERSTGRFLIEGEPATSFYLYEWAGVNPDNGNPLWVDKDGNKTETNIQLAANANSNRKMMGDAMPKFFGGMDNTFSYKGLEFNAFFSYAYGNKMMNGAKAYLYAYTSNEANNLSPDLLNYWKTPGQQTDIPALLNKSNSSGTTPSGTDFTLGRNTSRFLEDASYIKLRTVSLAYKFSPAMLKKLRILSSLRVYVQADNVLVITKYSGIDPEVSAFGSSALQIGSDEFTMPAPRTFRIGVKMGF
ncbi:TonB-dependent receptor [Pedobacter sp. ok626]|uniref:TonB-dependent receptor n=1 Tax=Pedobacter sp. ok626 TaxID=1761882 RepID=UPI0014054850|nr:TonB-dependent receptor [Pedobacter sp. ok626]